MPLQLSTPPAFYMFALLHTPVLFTVLATGRIAPDRRWFGNTRVVGAAELDRFREEMTDKMADPYSVVVKRRKLPMGLIKDAAEFAHKGNNAGLLANQPFEQAFGSKSRRKRVKIEQMLVGRTLKMDGGGKEGSSKARDRGAPTKALPFGRCVRVSPPS